MSNEMMYTDDLRFGEDYRKLRRCIGISILDYDLLEDAEFCEKLLDEYHIK